MSHDSDFPEGCSVYTFTVYDGEWSGFYVNGALIQEGHSLQIEPCLEELVGYEVLSYGHLYDKDNKLGDLEQFGYAMPQNINDLWRLLR